jgi:predicted membrane GTPase involved in stress response
LYAYGADFGAVSSASDMIDGVLLVWDAADNPGLTRLEFGKALEG